MPCLGAYTTKENNSCCFCSKDNNNFIKTSCIFSKQTSCVIIFRRSGRRWSSPSWSEQIIKVQASASKSLVIVSLLQINQRWTIIVIFLFPILYMYCLAVWVHKFLWKILVLLLIGLCSSCTKMWRAPSVVSTTSRCTNYARCTNVQVWSTNAMFDANAENWIGLCTAIEQYCLSFNITKGRWTCFLLHLGVWSVLVECVCMLISLLAPNYIQCSCYMWEMAKVLARKATPSSYTNHSENSKRHRCKTTHVL